RRHHRSRAHAEDGAEQRHTQAKVRPEVGDEAGRPFIGVNNVDPAATRKGDELRDPRWRGPPAEAVGIDEFQSALVDYVHERPSHTEDHDLVAGFGHARGKVDGVDLASADSKIVRHDEYPHPTVLRAD